MYLGFACFVSSIEFSHPCAMRFLDIFWSNTFDNTQRFIVSVLLFRGVIFNINSFYEELQF